VKLVRTLTLILSVHVGVNECHSIRIRTSLGLYTAPVCGQLGPEFLRANMARANLCRDMSRSQRTILRLFTTVPLMMRVPIAGTMNMLRWPKGALFQFPGYACLGPTFGDPIVDEAQTKGGVSVARNYLY
jgi:hypothetical protein